MRVANYLVQIGQVPGAHVFLLGNPALPKLFPNFEKANKVQEVRAHLPTRYGTELNPAISLPSL